MESTRTGERKGNGRGLAAGKLTPDAKLASTTIGLKGEASTAKRDPRLKLSLRGGGELLERWRGTLERIHGRPLSWDEVFLHLSAYVDLTEKSTVTWAEAEMQRLARDFETRGLRNEAHLLQLFAGLLVDVMTGRLTIDEVESCLLLPGGAK